MYTLCQSKTVVLNLSWFVASFQRLVAPCSSIGFCNIRAELFSKGHCSWPPGNRSVAPKRGRGSRLRNPGLNQGISQAAWRQAKARQNERLSPLCGVLLRLYSDIQQNLRYTWVWSRDTVLTRKVWEGIQKIAILKQLPSHFKAIREKGVGTPFPRVPNPLHPWCEVRTT